MHRRPIVQMIVAGVIASAIGIAIGLSIHWFPAQAASQAHEIDRLYKVLIVASVPIFVLVVTVVLFSVWQFRARPGDELKDGPPIHGSTRLEVVWTVIPAILIIGLVSYSFVVLHDIEKKPAGAEMQVNVTGQQFAWSYQYPASATGGAAVQSDVLYLPQGESVRFNMTSKDVIHAFWVPAFRLQEDVVPGITTHYRITPTQLGTYDVICNELCGLGHAVMRSTVHVVTPAEFQAWLHSKVSPAGSAAGAGGAASGGATSPTQQAALAKQIFTGAAGCGACHTLAAAGTTGAVGPNLDKVLKGSKHTAAFIRTSIVSPNAYIEPGYPPNVMPQSFGSTLSKQQIDALVAYLQKVTGP